MTKLLSVLVSIILIFSACASQAGFDFRDSDRPSYDKAISVEELKDRSGETDLTVLDVRLLEDYQANEALIPGASYVNPEEIELWASNIPQNEKVVVYCVKGKWVSQKAASILAERGIETYTLKGGIEAWQQADYETE